MSSVNQSDAISAISDRTPAGGSETCTYPFPDIVSRSVHLKAPGYCVLETGALPVNLNVSVLHCLHSCACTYLYCFSSAGHLAAIGLALHALAYATVIVCLGYVV
jgi:hypothetical protein